MARLDELTGLTLGPTLSDGDVRNVCHGLSPEAGEAFLAG